MNPVTGTDTGHRCSVYPVTVTGSTAWIPSQVRFLQCGFYHRCDVLVMVLDLVTGTASLVDTVADIHLA